MNKSLGSLNSHWTHHIIRINGVDSADFTHSWDEDEDEDARMSDSHLFTHKKGRKPRLRLLINTTGGRGE